jgi:hypothetical protein
MALDFLHRLPGDFGVGFCPGRFDFDIVSECLYAIDSLRGFFRGILFPEPWTKPESVTTPSLTATAAMSSGETIVGSHFNSAMTA